MKTGRMTKNIYGSVRTTSGTVNKGRGSSKKSFGDHNYAGMK